MKLATITKLNAFLAKLIDLRNEAEELQDLCDVEALDVSGADNEPYQNVNDAFVDLYNELESAVFNFEDVIPEQES